MSETGLVKLHCKFCGSRLEGENNSKVFFCRKCKKAFDILDKEADSEDFFFAAPFLKREFPTVYFPFQRIETVYKIKAEENGEPGKFHHVFLLPLFFIKNISYFGDIGYYYFLKRTTPLIDEDRGVQIFPADRNFNDVKQYPRIYVMQNETERKDADSVHVEASVSRSGVVMIPFFKNGTDYYDSYLFWKYPSGSLI